MRSPNLFGRLDSALPANFKTRGAALLAVAALQLGILGVMLSDRIHLLKTGEVAKTPPKVESYDRPENDQRPGGFDNRDDRGQRDDRRPRFEGRRDERRDERPQRFEDRPPRRDEPVRPAKSAAPWKADPTRKPKVVTPPPGYKPAAAKPAVVKPVVAKAPVESPVETKAEPVKTFSDDEILASVKTPEPKTESKLFVKPKTLTAAPKAKTSRATPGDQTRLWMSVGEEQGVLPIDVVNAVAGETGLPGKVVGTVDVREKHLFVDVSSEHANGIIAKLNRASIKGHKVKVKIA